MVTDPRHGAEIPNKVEAGSARPEIVDCTLKNCLRISSLLCYYCPTSFDIHGYDDRSRGIIQFL